MDNVARIVVLRRALAATIVALAIAIALSSASAAAAAGETASSVAKRAAHGAATLSTDLVSWNLQSAVNRPIDDKRHRE